MNFGATFIVVNLSLAFFNLIPIPPLDGSSIIVPFLKGKALANYYRLQQYAMPILIIVLYLLPMSNRHRRDRPLFRRYRVSVGRVAAQLRNRRHLR